MSNIYVMCLGRTREVPDLKLNLERRSAVIYLDDGKPKNAAGEEERAEQIMTCDLFLLFADLHLLTKTDCYRDQLLYANLQKKKTACLLFTEDQSVSELPESERELFSNTDQMTGSIVFATVDNWQIKLDEILDSDFPVKSASEPPAESEPDCTSIPTPSMKNPVENRKTPDSTPGSASSAEDSVYCPTCGHCNSASSKFCMYCGSVMTDSTDQSGQNTKYSMKNPSCENGYCGGYGSYDSESYTPDSYSSGSSGSGSSGSGSYGSGSYGSGSYGSGSSGSGSYGSGSYGSGSYGSDSYRSTPDAYPQSRPKPFKRFAPLDIKKYILIIAVIAAVIILGYLAVRYAVPSLRNIVQTQNLLLPCLLLLAILVLLIIGLILIKRRMDSIEEHLLDEIKKVQFTTESTTWQLKGDLQSISYFINMRSQTDDYRYLLNAISGMQENLKKNSSDIEKLLDEFTADKTAIGRDMQELRTMVQNGTLNLDSYTFISYCHRTQFHPIRKLIEQMNSQGYATWYDSHLSGGCSFNDEIAEHIKYSICFIPMIDKQYVASDFCREELFYAISNRCNIIPVFLEETTLTPGMEMRLSTQTHSLFKFNYQDENSFYQDLFQSGILQDIKTNQTKAALQDEKSCNRNSLS